ncbi:PfkB family carbohydrate kinase [Streptomyces mayteni]
MSGRLVLVGNVIADLVIEIPALPERGGDVIGSRSELTAGGGFNTLVAARRLGAEVVFAGPHGTGPHGDLVRRALAAEGIEPLLPARDDGDTGFTVALVDGGGERTFVTSFGVERHLTAADLAAIAAGPRPGDTVQLSGYALVSPDNGPPLAGFAAALPADVTLCLDPAPLVADIPPAVLDPVLARVDWLSANAREASLLTGLPEPADAAAALRRRLSPGAGVIVRDGPRGCWLASPGEAPTPVPGFPVTAVDTNGAGDAHVGSFLALLAAGRDPVAAARAANAAAAYAVTGVGPATAPNEAQLAEFLAEHDR